MSILPFTKYKLRISCNTYNHACYIEDTMNGFCMQKTNFPFLAIIFDDASTDGEADVIRKYLNDNFDMSHAKQEENEDAVIIAAIHKENTNCHFLVVLLKYNFYCIKKAKSPFVKGWYEDVPYIAMCEGDDYWTDSIKLQKQVDYLETHPDCGLVYTNAMILNQKNGRLDKTTLPRQADFDNLLFESPIMTLTTCFRREVVAQYSNDIRKMPKRGIGDLPQWLYIAAKSSIKYLPDITAIYRVLTNSASHKGSFTQSMDFSLNSFDIRLYFAHKYHREHLIPKMAKAQINELFKIAISYDKNISGQIMKIAFKHKVFDIKIWAKIILYATQLGRNYHQRKYA